MSKRNRREHGRIISVETKTRGDALADDFAAGVTSITVEDAGDFDEDGGWLLIGGQVVEFTECDDDTGVITLADPLDAAAEQGDPVQVWSELYEEAVDYQQALVELDGEYDNPDPVVAEVAEGVGELPEGDRGKAGESCTLKRMSEDEWEVVAVGGRSSRSKDTRFEQDDYYVLTAADITAGTATMPLSHRPADEALTCVLAGAPQRPTSWTIDYDAQTLTVPLSGWEEPGDVLWVHYAYRKGLPKSRVGLAAQLVNTTSGNSSTPTMPPGAQDGDLIVISVAVPGGGGVSTANGYATAVDTATVTHAAHFGTYTYRLMVLSRILSGGTTPVPTISGGSDVIWVATLWRGPGAVSMEAHGTVGDAKAAATPALTSADIRTWVAIGNMPVISLTGQGTAVGARNTGSDVCILVATDAGDGAVSAETAASSAGWMVATVSLEGT